MSGAGQTRFDAEYSGTTACLALLHHGQAVLANVGDSRAMLGRREADGRLRGVPLTQDAKPDDAQVCARRTRSSGGRHC